MNDMYVGLVVNNQGETNRFNLDIELYSASWSPAAGTSVIVKGGMYIHELERIPKDGFTCIQLKRNSAILPRSADTTSPPS